MAEPTAERVHAFDQFMLQEYNTIASAHFELHNGLRQNFRFYLGLAALPFTVLAIAFKETASVWTLPDVLTFLFGITSLIGFLMFLALINIRFDIILYTRTVNGVRAYFSERANELGARETERFLKLPIDKSKPPYREGPRRAYFWQFLMVGLINTIFALIFLRNLTDWYPSVILSIAYLCLHILGYLFLSRARDKREILGTRNAKNP